MEHFILISLTVITVIAGSFLLVKSNARYRAMKKINTNLKNKEL